MTSGKSKGVCDRRTESNWELLICEKNLIWVALRPGAAEHVGSHFWLPQGKQ